MPKFVERCRTSSSSSTNEPGSSSASIRSRAVWRPLACWRSTAAALPACTASSMRRYRSASLPAVVCGSGSSASAPEASRHRRRGAHGRGLVAHSWADLSQRRPGYRGAARVTSRSESHARLGLQTRRATRLYAGWKPLPRASRLRHMRVAARRAIAGAVHRHRPRSGGMPVPSAAWTVEPYRPWDAAALRAALVGPAGPWARLDVVERVGSTNAELLAAAAPGPRTGRCSSPSTRTRGGAGWGATWVTPPGTGLAVSVLLRPRGGVAGPVRLAAAARRSGSARRRARARRRRATCLKWPNDLLARARSSARPPGSSPRRRPAPTAPRSSSGSG